MNADLVPSLDPTAIPGPQWLFHTLVVFTFFLHALFMNLTLGGTLLATVAQFASGGRAGDFRSVIARRLMGVNAYGISLAITTGVAPLLFVQLLYQQYFYTATILIGWVWLSFVVMVMVGYYAAYAYKFRSLPRGGAGGSLWLAISTAMFLLVAMIHVAVHLIHAQPGKWPAAAANPVSILADPTYLPRLLHFVLAATGFSALVTAWWAMRQAAAGNDVAVNTHIARWSWRWALGTTLLQVADGFLLLFVLPHDVLLGLMRGGVATLAPLTISVLLGVGLLMMLSRVSNPVEKPGLVSGTLAAMFLTIAVMSMTRHQVREIYLAPTASQYSIGTDPQWANFVLFALLLIAGLATVLYMVRRVLVDRAAGERSA